MYTVSSPGQYTVIVTDSCGYKDTGQYVVQYYPTDPTQYLFPGSPVWLCPGRDTTLYITLDKALSWKKDGTVITGITDSFLHITQTGTYEVTYQNMYGCEQTATVMVNQQMLYHNLIYVTGNPLCQGDTVQLQSNKIGQAYLWATQAPLSCPTCFNTDGWPQQDRKVYFTLTDPYGCVHHDSTLLEVDITPVLTMSPDTAICPGPVHAHRGHAHQPDGSPLVPVAALIPRCNRLTACNPLPVPLRPPRTRSPLRRAPARHRTA